MVIYRQIPVAYGNVMNGVSVQKYCIMCNEKWTIMFNYRPSVVADRDGVKQELKQRFKNEYENITIIDRPFILNEIHDM